MVEGIVKGFWGLWRRRRELWVGLVFRFRMGGG